MATATNLRMNEALWRWGIAAEPRRRAVPARWRDVPGGFHSRVKGIDSEGWNRRQLAARRLDEPAAAAVPA
jgi:hypothetical protein